MAARGTRRFSEALAEGDGISFVAEVGEAEAAHAAERAGADALLVARAGEGRLREIRAACTLPILFFYDGQSRAAIEPADACVVDFTGDESWEHVRFELEDSFELVVRARDEDVLRAALDAFDPEVLLLAPTADEAQRALEHALGLLADVPAGKLAVVSVDGLTRDAVDELERAGVDGVVVPAGAVAVLAGAAAGGR